MIKANKHGEEAYGLLLDDAISLSKRILGSSGRPVKQ
jgi:hypothetical protein